MALPPGAYSSQQAQRQEKRPHGFQKYAINNYDPQQEQLFGEGFEHLDRNSYTSRLARGDDSAFAELEEPSLRQFGQLQGGIASRFSGMGMGGRNSSGFQNSMNTAAQDFASQLKSQRSDMRRNAILDLMGMSDRLLNQRPQEKGYAEKPHKESWADSALKWYTAYQGGQNRGGGGGFDVSDVSKYIPMIMGG